MLHEAVAVHDTVWKLYFIKSVHCCQTTKLW